MYSQYWKVTLIMQSNLSFEKKNGRTKNCELRKRKPFKAWENVSWQICYLVKGSPGSPPSCRCCRWQTKTEDWRGCSGQPSASGGRSSPEFPSPGCLWRSTEASTAKTKTVTRKFSGYQSNICYKCQSKARSCFFEFVQLLGGFNAHVDTAADG